MILVHLNQSWPEVEAGERTERDVTLGDWALVSDTSIERYGDVVCGVHHGLVVTAFDITGYERRPDGRVRFQGEPSSTWSHLVGDPSPLNWVRGQARPVRYIDTELVMNGMIEPEAVDEGGHRAVVGGYVLTVDADGDATLSVPAAGKVMVVGRQS